MSDEVLVAYAGPTVIITINLSEAKNSINRAVTGGVADAIEELEARADLTVGILTGADGTFSAGMDLRAFLAGEDLDHPRGLAGITRQSKNLFEQLFRAVPAELHKFRPEPTVFGDGNQREDHGRENQSHSSQNRQGKILNIIHI